VEGESTLVAEDVESLAVGVLGGGGVVFTLIEKGPSLLACERLNLNWTAFMLNMVEVFSPCSRPEARGGSSSSWRTRGSTRSTIEAGVQPLRQLGNHGGAYQLGIHGLGENLQRENVVVAVDDQARQEISFAEDDAVSIRVVDKRLAIGNGISDALAKQGREIGDHVMRNQADGDLRRAGIERTPEKLSAMICDCDERSGRGFVR